MNFPAYNVGVTIENIPQTSKSCFNKINKQVSTFTWYEFHDNHDRLPHSSDADELDNIVMGVLFEYSAFLEEFLLLVIRQSFLTRLDSNFQIFRFVITSIYIPKVTLMTK